MKKSVAAAFIVFSAVALRAATPISTVQEFIDNVVADPTGDYILTADLAFDDLAAIPTFSGTLDGDGHWITGIASNLIQNLTGTVKNVRIKDVIFRPGRVGTFQPSGAAIAIEMNGAWISGCVISNCTFSPKNNYECYHAAVAAKCSSGNNVISNCVAYGCVIGLLQGNIIAGGMVARVSAGNLEIVDCKVCDSAETAASIKASSVGAAFGHMAGSATTTTVTRCVNYATMTAVNCAAGIAGYAYGGNDCQLLTSVSGCANYGDITGGTAAGGIVGGATKGGTVLISGCTNLGTVVSTATSAQAYGGAGGILGGLGSTYDRERFYINKCLNRGYVASTNYYAGGIVGRLKENNDAGRYSSVSNSANYAEVVGGDSVGGIIGQLCYPASGATVVNCFNAGEIVGLDDAKAGGIVGSMESAGNSISFNFASVCNVGSVCSGSGDAGGCVGSYSFNQAKSKTYNFDIRSGIFGGAVSGGRTALVHCGNGNSAAGSITYNLNVDANCRFAGDCSGVAYYDKSGVAQTISGLVALGQNDLTDGKAAKILNDYASANGLVSWVQTANYPELSIFASGPVPPTPTVDHGLLIFLR